MTPSTRMSRGRLTLAVLISLALHGSAAIGWLKLRENSAEIGLGPDSRVSAPADEEHAFTLLDRSPIVLTAKSPPKPIDSPRTLPTEVLTPMTPRATPQPGSSPAGPESLPKTVTTSRLFAGGKPTGSVVFLLDRSSSMGPDGLLRRATEELLAAVGQLEGETRFQVVAYNGSATTPGPELRNATPESNTRLATWLAGLSAEGRSDHVAGFREALTLRPSHLILLTDADDLDLREVKELAGLIDTNVRLDAFVFGDSLRPASESPLERLTGRHRGVVKYLR